MNTRITVPPSEIEITLDDRALLNPYGRVTGLAYDDRSPRVTITLHDGTRLVLARDGGDWALRPADGEHHLAVTRLDGPGGAMPFAVREAMDETWRAAWSMVDQFAARIVEAAAGDLVPLLDRAVTSPPF
ncbi:hypothetical protein [Saccharothrix sp.]|uniref:hypothetical protein n=1 Tax=Saccharothrix sp. TaxID=1873460 RepID=UPI002810DF9E|nr:hypothetical protein [Saccharothrix sp.]